MNNRDPARPFHQRTALRASLWTSAGFSQPFHSQEWSSSNFPCSLPKTITSHSMKNLAFHSLLRYKMIISTGDSNLIHWSRECALGVWIERVNIYSPKEPKKNTGSSRNLPLVVTEIRKRAKLLITFSGGGAQSGLKIEPNQFCHSLESLWNTLRWKALFSTQVFHRLLMFNRFTPIHEWSISNFPCSPTGMKNLAFHSLLRWKMIILPIITTSLIHFSLKGWENYFFKTSEWKGFNRETERPHKMSARLSSSSKKSWIANNGGYTGDKGQLNPRSESQQSRQCELNMNHDTFYVDETTTHASP